MSMNLHNILPGCLPIISFLSHSEKPKKKRKQTTKKVGCFLILEDLGTGFFSRYE